MKYLQMCLDALQYVIMFLCTTVLFQTSQVFRCCYTEHAVWDRGNWVCAVSISVWSCNLLNMQCSKTILGSIFIRKLVLNCGKKREVDSNCKVFNKKWSLRSWGVSLKFVSTFHFWLKLKKVTSTTWRPTCIFDCGSDWMEDPQPATQSCAGIPWDDFCHPAR
jgi:hypothetical protein